jgi:hypothetical protein
MTRKVTLLALAIAALLVPAGGASAAATPPPDEIRAAASGQQIKSAAFAPLNRTTARRLALKLAREVASDRNVRWWQLSARPVKVRSSRITFAYADRTRANTYCTSTIAVEQPTRRLRRTSFIGGRCTGVPAEALAVERETSRFIRAAQGQESDLRRSIGNYNEQLANCEELRIPRSRLSQVRRIFMAHEYAAAVGPIEGEIGEFVVALDALRLQRPELAAAPRAWEAMNAAVNLIRSEMVDAPQPCDAVRRWARDGWSASASPGDPRQGLADAQAAERSLLRVARELAALGVSPRAAQGMTPGGLIELAAPTFITCRGTRELTAAQGCQ